MNKSELIAAVAAQADSDQAVARRHVDAVFETIMNSVVAGERVVVTGFGTFDRVTRAARTFRNPRTGQPIQVASSQAPRFSVGRTFKENVSGAPAPETSSGRSAAAAAQSTVTDKVSARVSAEPVAPEAPTGKKKKKRKDLAARANGSKKKTNTAKPTKPKSNSKSGKKPARKGR
jgi:DNA-binding protein HU-beta